ncbi:maleylpyruvate isomerase family mycothiol-dependent enzyme [Mycobacterium sp. Aquia_213]|uniref:maleylpyruvate isomerase family mycothiol-dependent enzyme n=1 Tax=Mycobacterium sp. Aquia_213 TaxID=2991728 RepID=UPI00226E82BF|nr:maleylpyruvate isomerase family mycothiol-dependent enzyme [Mycobacterium sp. Aquia_213]WAC91903.1 maleylpyruvate isomerase family mycothiol-dependent enzyme [Mycobacterium sp. Aquia_213]
MSPSVKALQDNDTRLVEWARGITTAQWEKPSLCTEWTNHEVLAHLVIGYGVAFSAVATSMLRHRGSFDAANTELARVLADQRGPDQLLGDLVALGERPRGIGRLFPKRLLLGDHVVHELDITYALGKESAVPVSAVVAVLNTQVRVPNPFVPAAARARGLNLVATDADWAHRTDGPTVTGQAAHLASVLAGRPWGLSHLRGDGVAVLSTRM